MKIQELANQAHEEKVAKEVQYEMDWSNGMTPKTEKAFNQFVHGQVQADKIEGIEVHVDGIVLFYRPSNGSFYTKGNCEKCGEAVDSDDVNNLEELHNLLQEFKPHYTHYCNEEWINSQQLIEEIEIDANRFDDGAFEQSIAGSLITMNKVLVGIMQALYQIAPH